MKKRKTETKKTHPNYVNMASRREKVATKAAPSAERLHNSEKEGGWGEEWRREWSANARLYMVQ